MDQSSIVGAVTGRCLDGCGLTVHQRVMLPFAMRRHASGRPTSVADFAQTLGGSTRQAERHLRGLLDAGLLSYETQRPATFRPNWYELEEWATRQDDAVSTSNVAYATDPSRWNHGNDVAIATDPSRTAVALARRVGHVAAPAPAPAAPAPAPAPPTSEPLLAAGNPEPPLPAARPAPLSDSEATKVTAAATRWLKSEYRIDFPKGIRGMLKPAILRGQSEAELRYAARETATACPDSRGSYFLTILDRLWTDGVALWSELAPPPERVDEETGEILDSVPEHKVSQTLLARFRSGA